MTRKLNPSVFLTLDPILDQNEFLFGSGFDGYVYQLEQGESDDGDDIEGYWKTGWIDMDVPELVKMFVSIHVGIEQYAGLLYVDWSVDYGASTGSIELRPPRNEGGVWHSVNNTWSSTLHVWGGPADVRKKRMIAQFPQSAEGQRLQLTLRAEDKIRAWQVTDFSIFYKVKDSLVPLADI